MPSWVEAVIAGADSSNATVEAVAETCFLYSCQSRFPALITRLQRSLDKLADAFEARIDFDRLMEIVFESTLTQDSQHAG